MKIYIDLSKIKEVKEKKPIELTDNEKTLLEAILKNKESQAWDQTRRQREVIHQRRRYGL